MKNFKNIATALIHGGVDGDETSGAVNIPIYQTSTYRQEGLGKHKGYEYSRTGNPTREALEKLAADLEGGDYGMAFASGMAATTAVLSLFQTGDKIIISKNVYGGTFRVLDKVFNRFGIQYEIVDTADNDSLKEALTEEVKAVFIESPANPLMSVTDIKEAGEAVHQYGKLLIVDNTFMTPYLQRPLLLGADVVVHSATKYLGGHSDLIAGLVVVKDEKLADKLFFIQNATGGILQPFDSFLLIRGIKTLGVRMEKHQENAMAAAKWLEDNKAVEKVYYPGLQTDPGYHVQKVQADGPGAMISFTLKEEYRIERFFEGLKMISPAESLGGVESLICHPASMTHASIPEEMRKQIGITDNLIRLSVGIEKIDDILEDLDRAVKFSREDK